jgi:hypothetical protein
MTGHINITSVLVLQSCSDSLHILPSSSSEKFPTSSDGAFGVGNVKVERDVEMEEFNLKTENGIDSEEEKCVGVQSEEGVCIEENVEIKEEILDIKEEILDIKEEILDIKEEILDIKEEVRSCFWFAVCVM